MNYYIQPPIYYKNLPKPALKFFYRALARWADQEYEKALQDAVNRRDYWLHRTLTREWSGMRVLATHPEFHGFCGQLYADGKIWNDLGKHFRDFYCRAMELYEGLRDTKLVPQ